MRGARHGVRTPSAQQDFPDEERHMIGATKAIKTLVVAATIISSLTLPAYSQGLNKRPGSGGDAGPPLENHPKAEEEAYKAALLRIPGPAKKFYPCAPPPPAEPPRPRQNRSKP